MDKFKLTITSILALAGVSFFPASISATDPGVPTIDSDEVDRGHGNINTRWRTISTIIGFQVDTSKLH